jgi:hypothetical protein
MFDWVYFVYSLYGTYTAWYEVVTLTGVILDTQDNTKFIRGIFTKDGVK